MARKFMFLKTGASSFTRPTDWNNSENVVHCLGAGSRPGGGAYSAKDNVVLAPGSVAYQVGAGNSVVDSWLVSSVTVMAKAGNGLTPGSAASSVGDRKFSGGTRLSGSGYGGGGAAGPNGDGGNSTDMGPGDNSGGGGADGGDDIIEPMTGGLNRLGGAPPAPGAGQTQGEARPVAEVLWTQTSNGETAGPGPGGSEDNGAFNNNGANYGGGAGSFGTGIGGDGLIVLEWEPRPGDDMSFSIVG